MRIARTLVSLVAGAGALFAVSQAGDIVACPDDYPVQAASYVESRLEDPRGARVEVISEPYRVAADLSGHPDVQGWGVDIKVKSRLPTGSYGGTMDYTVIFVNGEPVALCEDTRGLDRV